MIYAWYGDTTTPIDDPLENEHDIEQEIQTGYAQVYPKYVPSSKKSNVPGWIDASPNRDKIRAFLWVLFGLIIVLIIFVFAIPIWMHLAQPSTTSSNVLKNAKVSSVQSASTSNSTKR